MKKLIILSTIFALPSVGCGDDEPELCELEEPFCDDGTSCLAGVCVDDGTRRLNAACAEDRQCVSGLDCRASACRMGCGDAYFEEDDGCAANEYCAPLADTDGTLGGYCVPSECANDTQCVVDDFVFECIPIKEGAGACLTECEVTLSPEYDDTCIANQFTGPLTCQPLGRDSASDGARLVCSSQGDAVVGAPCDPITTPCGRGLVCHPQEAVCLEYCEANTCSAGEVCCGETFGTVSYGVCRSSCG